jgi:hypothetical protein
MIKIETWLNEERLNWWNWKVDKFKDVLASKVQEPNKIKPTVLKCFGPFIHAQLYRSNDQKPTVQWPKAQIKLSLQDYKTQDL